MHLLELKSLGGKMTKAAVSLGSNFDAKQNLKIALQALCNIFPNIKISKSYQTKPVGLITQDFINLVVLVDTNLQIDEFFAICKKVEALVPPQKQKGNGAYTRALDLDILIFGDFCDSFENHKLPRPDLLKHNFALRPLAEIYPHGILPETNKTFAQLWLEFADTNQTMQEVNL